MLEITTKEQFEVVNEYIKKSQNKTTEERKTEGRKKTGVFTGSYAINQLNNEEMPIYVADFVLMDVGTGAVVGVPGHDKRDFEFAQAMDLPIKRVVVGPDGDISLITKVEQVQEESGKMVNSGFLNGFDIQVSIKKMMEHLEEKGWGKRVTTYHLRDWLISRQRYWGAPIPMIYCSTCAEKKQSWFSSKEASSIVKLLNCYIVNNKTIEQYNHDMVGWFPVPEDQLPVLLPDVADWKPTGTGRGPLAGHPEFYETKCPHCGGPADRETDVCDTFLDSAWYYLRYPSVSQDKNNSPQPSLTKGGSVPPLYKMGLGGVTESIPWDNSINTRWLPVHSYIGGAEHTVLHLLYARFVWMALRDWGYISLNLKRNTDSGVSPVLTGPPQNDVILANEVRPESETSWDPDEPFRRFFAHGLIIKDGAKMSKSKGNVVVPDEYISLYGADTLRTYLMFLGPFEGGGDFRDSGIAGMYRWLSRVWRLVEESANFQIQNSAASVQDGKKLLAKTIKSVTQDLEELHYNTAIARLMEYTNWWMEHKNVVTTEDIVIFLKLLAPFAPHMTEELYQFLKVKSQKSKVKIDKEKFISIHQESWPKHDEQLTQEEAVTVIVQINGKMRDSLLLAVRIAKDQNQVEQLAKSSAKIQRWLQDKKMIKTVFIPGRLINFVVSG